MRIKNDSFETLVKQALRNEPESSADFETHLFAKAEELLSQRREKITLQELKFRKAALARKQWLLTFQTKVSQQLEYFAIHPDRPATAMVVAVLLAAFFSLQRKAHDPHVSLSYADLPPFSKTNDFPARYEAQILAERQAYEREVRDAHQKTSGGI